MEIRLKLSDTLLIYQQLLKKFKINSRNRALKNRVLLTVCKSKMSDIIAFSYLEKELTRHYCPTQFSAIQIIPHTELEKIF